jgi:DNA gyrase subunit A
MKLADARGSLVGAMVVTNGDEVLAIKASGQVTRSSASDVPAKGRDTMGVKFVTVGDSDSVVAIARNTESEVDEAVLGDDADSAETAVTSAEDAVETSSTDTAQEDSQETDPAEEEGS